MDQAPAPVVRTDDTAHLPRGSYLGSPFAGGPSWLKLRAVTMTIGVCILTVVPGIEQRWLLVVVFAVATAAQLPLGLLVRDKTTVSALVVLSDIVLCGVLTVIQPDLWPATMLWLGSIVTWQAIVLPQRIAARLTAAALVVSTAVGVATDLPKWWLVVATQAVVTCAFTATGWSLRRDVAESEIELQATVAAAGAVVTYSDLDAGGVIDIVGDIEAITGYTRKQWLALDHRALVHPDDIDQYWIRADQVTSNAIIDRVGRIRHANGSWIWLRDVARINIDHSGRRTMRGFFLDVTAVEESNRRIAQQARLDVVTGLPNRLALIERLTELTAAGADFALLLIDLDRFKEVNDTLGHEAGDQVLRIVADRLRAAISPRDHLSRLGGDEFAIIVHGARTPDDGAAAIDVLATEGSRPIEAFGIQLALSMSTGVALSSPGDDRATIMRHADIAMYEAKRRGASHHVFDASLEQTSTMQLSLSAALGEAIAKRHIRLHYQPLYDLSSGSLVGAEGLARWHHPEFGQLTPDRFLDIALMSESVGEFTMAMIQQGIAMIQRCCRAGRPITIAVNVAMRTLRDVSFAPTVLGMLRAADAPPNLLTIEITESDVLEPSAEMIRALELLGDGGVGIAVDDFGTGHSSLARLQSFRVSELKIDRSFVENVLGNARDRQIIRSIIGLANGLGYRVVAEGIERSEQALMLASMGCPIGQGYLFSKPLPADEFTALALGEGAARQLDDRLDGSPTCLA